MSYEIRKNPGDTTWFRHDRFGMLVNTVSLGG